MPMLEALSCILEHIYDEAISDSRINHCKLFACFMLEVDSDSVCNDKFRKFGNQVRYIRQTLVSDIRYP